MTVLLVSDLHLDPARPDITRCFLDFLGGEARSAARLYVLGDLFEAWIGDDDPGETGLAVASALASLAGDGVAIGFLHGNRDFLLGRRFADAARMRLLPDPVVVPIAGTPVLLTHGDALCTDDTAYQRFREQTRDRTWQAAFLAQPVAARRAFATQARAASAAHQQSLQAAGVPGNDITDVADAAVATLFRLYGVCRVIHGHTHRPAVHRLDVDGVPRERIVLGDWYHQGSVLRIAADGEAQLAQLQL